jgi:hypothetical protein
LDQTTQPDKGHPYQEADLQLGEAERFEGFLKAADRCGALLPQGPGQHSQSQHKMHPRSTQ